MEWKAETFRLSDNHRWSARPGHKVFVANAGEVRFDIPEEWVMEPGPDSIRFHDRPPPDDDILLQVSVLHLPPGIDWSELPLVELLQVALQSDSRGLGPVVRTVYEKRDELELAWQEAGFVDPDTGRAALSRACLARAAGIQPFITLDFWVEDTGRCDVVWGEVLGTLRLGEYIRDPTLGPER